MSSLNGANLNNMNANSNNPNLPSNALNEEHLIRRLKELLQKPEDDKTPPDHIYS